MAHCAHQAMSMVCKQNINEDSAKEKQRNFHLQAWQLDKKNLYSEAQILHSSKPICTRGPKVMWNFGIKQVQIVIVDYF